MCWDELTVKKTRPRGRVGREGCARGGQTEENSQSCEQMVDPARCQKNKHWQRQFSLSCVTRRFFKMGSRQIYIRQLHRRVHADTAEATHGVGGERGGDPVVSTVGGAEGRPSST